MSPVAPGAVGWWLGTPRRLVVLARARSRFRTWPRPPSRTRTRLRSSAAPWQGSASCFRSCASRRSQAATTRCTSTTPVRGCRRSRQRWARTSRADQVSVVSALAPAAVAGSGACCRMRGCDRRFSRSSWGELLDCGPPSARRSHRGRLRSAGCAYPGRSRASRPRSWRARSSSGSVGGPSSPHPRRTSRSRVGWSASTGPSGERRW